MANDASNLSLPGPNRFHRLMLFLIRYSIPALLIGGSFIYLILDSGTAYYGREHNLLVQALWRPRIIMWFIASLWLVSAYRMQPDYPVSQSRAGKIFDEILRPVFFLPLIVAIFFQILNRPVMVSGISQTQALTMFLSSWAFCAGTAAFFGYRLRSRGKSHALWLRIVFALYVLAVFCSVAFAVYMNDLFYTIAIPIAGAATVLVLGVWVIIRKIVVRKFGLILHKPSVVSAIATACAFYFLVVAFITRSQFNPGLDPCYACGMG